MYSSCPNPLVITITTTLKLDFSQPNLHELLTRKDLENLETRSIVVLIICMTTHYDRHTVTKSSFSRRSFSLNHTCSSLVNQETQILKLGYLLSRFERQSLILLNCEGCLSLSLSYLSKDLLEAWKVGLIWLSYHP